MSAEVPQLREASCFTMPLDSSPWFQCPAKEDEIRREEEDSEEVDSEGKWRSKSPPTSDVSDESEPESPPPIVRRRVSFADALGLNLVSVKEFSCQDPEVEVKELLCGLETDKYYLSCLFTSPSPEVLLKKLEEKKVVLEAIELLPGTTTLRGTIRVANLCYDKAVYVRTTYNCWASHFDILAEYIPGSSDRDTDGFSFRLTLVPPFKPEGVRIEFCLRYETPTGEFWESNDGMNYVLFCLKQMHRDKEAKGRGRVKDKEEMTKPKGQRSCLKTASKKMWPESNPVAGTGEIQDSVSHKVAKAARKAVDNTEKYASEDCLQKTLVDSRRSRRRARVANVKDHFTQKETEALLGHFSSGEKNCSLIPECNVDTWSDATTTTELLKNEHADTRTDKAHILMYHQIPLLSLSWDRNSGQKDITNSPDNHAPCSGAVLEHQTEHTQNELDGSAGYTQGAHGSGTNSTINAVEELSCPPPIASHFQSFLNQSDEAMQPAGLKELIQVAQTETGIQDVLWPQASLHMTAASSSSLEEIQKSVCHVIDDPARDVGEGKPALNSISRRAEVEGVTSATSQLVNAPEAVGLDDHKASSQTSGTDQSAQEEVTAQETFVAHSATQTTTEGAAERTEPVVTHASKKIPQESAQSSGEIVAETMASIETIEKTAAETIVMNTEMAQKEGEMTPPQVTEAKKACAVETATTPTSSPWKPLGANERVSPGPWEREGKGGSELSVNTMAKVKGGESQDRVSPTSGDDTMTFTDTDRATVHERVHPMRQREGEEEMVAEGEGEGEHPFKILNEREYKESGEAKRDMIQEKEGDLSREMSHFKATRQDVAVVSETDRLECKVSKERREDYAAEDWKDEMEKCLGLGREQGYVNEPALYEQFTKASKGLEGECHRKSHSGMLTEGLGRMGGERCLMGDNSTVLTNSVGSEEEQGTVTLVKGKGKKLWDAAPKACAVEGSSGGMSLPSINALVDQPVAQDPCVPTPTPIQTLCSIQITLGGQDPFLFDLEETSPVCQVGTATWSTCAISAPLGDAHEKGVALRHGRPPQPVGHLQSPREEAEVHTQFPRIPAPGRGSDVARPAPLSLWLNEVCSLSAMSRGAVYALLFVMFFLTAYVCDLPVCLAIYLVSLYWWCCHGEKTPLPGAKVTD
ncbi:uncharacterized protein ppp1r3aa isoform X1 [Clupea harengus]|uniref:Uncharacterized protein ppp1r3aa isoform X1 n=1 Tax=Clupea harengus TaxID=7950 RepID=A0A6P8GTW5_CLUHA|nr:uncharacterized protein ppp1r3aa isoform X1 [Clupea harengus]